MGDGEKNQQNDRMENSKTFPSVLETKHNKMICLRKSKKQNQCRLYLKALSFLLFQLLTSQTPKQTCLGEDETQDYVTGRR